MGSPGTVSFTSRLRFSAGGDSSFIPNDDSRVFSGTKKQEGQAKHAHNTYQSKRVAVYLNFSNSLIIHEEKTREITTVKEVWKRDLNYHKIL